MLFFFFKGRIQSFAGTEAIIKYNYACSEAVVNLWQIIKSITRIALKNSVSSVQPLINILVPQSFRNSSFSTTITYFVLSKYYIIMMYYSALRFILCISSYLEFAYVGKIIVATVFDIFFKSFAPYRYLELPNAKLQFCNFFFRYVTFTLHRLKI
jgi:hypothetical protein